MLNKLVAAIIKQEESAGLIEVAIVDDRQIKKLNKKFRKKDKPTDVLAFPYGGGEPIIGDVIISRPITLRNAKKYGVTYQQELKRLVIHGVLHVLGYDHGKEMSHAEKIYEKL